MAKRGRPELDNSYIVNLTQVLSGIAMGIPREKRHNRVEVVIPAFAQFSNKVFNSLIFLLNKNVYMATRSRDTDPIVANVLGVPFVVYDIFKGINSGYKHNNVEIGENMFLTYYWREI